MTSYSDKGNGLADFKRPVALSGANACLCRLLEFNY